MYQMFSPVERELIVQNCWPYMSIASQFCALKIDISPAARVREKSLWEIFDSLMIWFLLWKEENAWLGAWLGRRTVSVRTQRLLVCIEGRCNERSSERLPTGSQLFLILLSFWHTVCTERGWFIILNRWFIFHWNLFFQMKDVGQTRTTICIIVTRPT